jgi:hypothetical protein
MFYRLVWNIPGLSSGKGSWHDDAVRPALMRYVSGMNAHCGSRTHWIESAPDPLGVVQEARVLMARVMRK